MQKTVIINRSKAQITVLVVKVEAKCNLKLSISRKMKYMFLKMTKFTCSTKNIFTWVCFSGGSDCKESACDAGDLGLIPGLGRSPGEGNDYPFQCSGRLENSMDRGAWEAWTWLSVFTFTFFHEVFSQKFKIRNTAHNWTSIHIFCFSFLKYYIYCYLIKQSSNRCKNHSIWENTSKFSFLKLKFFVWIFS